MPDQNRARFRGYAGPNYTQVPDELFDEQLPDLSGAELKVLLYIMRRTFGFKRESDNISISQMLNGLCSRSGRQLDRGVGLSKKTLLLAIRSLEEQDIIMTERRRSVEKGDEPTTYRLNVLAADAHDKPTEMTGGQSHHEDREESTPPVGEKLHHGGDDAITRSVGGKVRHGGDVKTTLPVGEKLHQGGGGETTPPPWGRNYPTQYKEREREKEKELSNFRKAPPDSFDIEETPANGTEGSQIQTILADAGESDRGRGVSRTTKNATNNGKSPEAAFMESEARQQLLTFVQDFGREFNDAASLRSSTSRMANLYHNAHIPMNAFIAHLYAARAITQERTGAIRATARAPDAESRKNKMGYFFSVLEDRLGLGEPPDDADDAGTMSDGAASFAATGTIRSPRTRLVK